MNKCLNCGHEYEGNYCPQCGQSSNLKRVNQRDLIYDTQHFLHLDNSLFYTSFLLLRKPGHMIQAYIDGKRVRHYKPISMVLVTGGIYGLLYYLTNLSPFNLFIQAFHFFDDRPHTDLLTVPDWVIKNYAFVEVLIFLPIFTLASYLVFRKAKLTFFEHIVINSYIASGRILVGIFTFPLLLIFDSLSYVIYAEVIVSFLELAFTYWSFSVLYSYFKEERAILLTAFTLLIFFICVCLILYLQ